MKLTNNLKNQINNFFESHTEEELKSIFKNLGLDLDENKNENVVNYNKLTNKDAYETLQKEIEKYVEFLKNETYYPYDKVEYFNETLKKLNQRMWPYDL